MPGSWSLGHPSSPMFLGQGGGLWGGEGSLSASWGSSHPASVSLAVGSLRQRDSPRSMLGSPCLWGLSGRVCSLPRPLREGVWILLETSPGYTEGGGSDLT